MRTFDYLVRHSNWLTTAALLVGLAAGATGTMDTAVTKLLAVHLPSLQPSMSADLEVDARLRVAALMGVGLLYAGTQHSRMTTGARACLSDIVVLALTHAGAPVLLAELCGSRPAEAHGARALFCALFCALTRARGGAQGGRRAWRWAGSTWAADRSCWTARWRTGWCANRKPLRLVRR